MDYLIAVGQQTSYIKVCIKLQSNTERGGTIQSW